MKDELILADTEFKDTCVCICGQRFNYDNIDTLVKDFEELQEHRKIEDELHIDFITRKCFFKTSSNQIIKVNVIGLDFRNGIIVVETEQKQNIFALKQEDYGKTWAKTREELE